MGLFDDELYLKNGLFFIGICLVNYDVMFIERILISEYL